MDVAYDHIQEETLTPEEVEDRANRQQNGLNSEFQEAFKAVSASPWGAKLGGFFGQVKKQSESLYSDAQKEYTAASSQATRGLTDLRSSLAEHTRGLSIPQAQAGAATTSFSDPTFALPDPEPSAEGSSSSSSATSATQPPPEGSEAAAPAENAERPESLPADIVKEATSMVSRFRSTAAKHLTEIQRAEDAADEALLKFGTNVRNFLRDAVTVTAPEVAAAAGAKIGVGGIGTGRSAGKDGQETEVLFETNDSEGRRVFHSSRFDAQLHVIHTSPPSFTQDPESGEWAAFEREFDVEKKTDAIAKDLERYEELRRVMGKLVPEVVDYKIFWKRYYFLRKVVEEEEKRRKEVLKGAAADTEEDIGWGDDDDDDDDDQVSTPNGNTDANTQSTTTLNAPVQKDLLKPASPRRSHEEDGKSTADSDASYDIVSGAVSRAPGSPKEDKKAEAEAESKKEESDEEDWE